MPRRGLLSRLLYPARVPDPEDELDAEELELWVEAADRDYFAGLDSEFVERARGLGVSGGMILDLGSRLGLAPMKILWEEENFLAIGVYRTLEMAESARQTAEAWNLGERMFFQVGEPGQMRFKTAYFDLVVSDGALHRFEDPPAVLDEIGRVAKPSGAILVRDLRRPGRLRMSRHMAAHRARYPEGLRDRFEAGVRAGFTPDEMVALVEASGLERARVLADETHVLVERRGADDPGSWVAERERYR